MKTFMYEDYYHSGHCIACITDMDDAIECFLNQLDENHVIKDFKFSDIKTDIEYVKQIIIDKLEKRGKYNIWISGDSCDPDDVEVLFIHKQKLIHKLN